MEPVKENNIKLILQDNEAIDKAIHAYYVNQSRDTVMDVLSAVYMKVQDNAQLLIPCDAPEAADKELMDFKTLELNNGSVAVVAFSLLENLELGPETESVTYPIALLFQSVLENDNVAGVLLNPWKEPFMLTKEIITLLLTPDSAM